VTVSKLCTPTAVHNFVLYMALARVLAVSGHISTGAQCYIC